MANSPKDQAILKKIGLSDADVRDMQTKHNAFVKSLNPAQRKSLKKSGESSKTAAATLGPDVKARDLEKFMRARAPSDAPILLFNRGGASSD